MMVKTAEQLLRAELVKVLRSDQYVQGQNCLRTLSLDDTDDQFCCLGVACDLVDSTAWVKRPAHDRWIYENESMSLLTHDVMTLYGFLEIDGQFEWASLPTTLAASLHKKYGDGCVFETCNESNISSLVALNDAGVSFSEIADVIEAEPTGMFSS